MVSKIPIERIMLETDAPFLPPEGYRGLPCEPAYVRKTAECLAEIKGLSVDEVDLITTNNALTFFDIK